MLRQRIFTGLGYLALGWLIVLACMLIKHWVETIKYFGPGFGGFVLLAILIAIVQPKNTEDETAD
jgi:hypothetical protein